MRVEREKNLHFPLFTLHSKNRRFLKVDYCGVIFDFDYTLGDATDAIFAGFEHAFSTMGLPVPDREAVRRTVGMQVQDAYTLLSGDEGPEGRERFYALFHPVARDMQARGVVELCPGARELLLALKDHGVPAAVVSTKNSDSLRAVLAAKGLSECFTHVLGGDIVARHKPDPEGVNRVLERWGLTAEQVLYCGDTVIDAETARNAGADFCAVLNGTTPAEAFEPWPHVHISPDLMDLKGWLGI